VFAPPILGRSVVVEPDRPVPEPWRDAAVVDVSDDTLAHTDDLAAAVDRLHRAWVERRPVVVRLEVADAVLAEPESTTTPAWKLGGDFTFLRERLHFLVWANSYDARTDPPVWWWGRKAARIGAAVGGPCDVVLPDGTPAWVDGGPRQTFPELADAVVHAETVGQGRLSTVPHPATAAADGLAPDQRAAALHPAGATRVVAPAGSGKTRTLTARLRHLLEDRLVEPELITAVAYNRRAAEELGERVGAVRRGLVRTIHSLGRAILHDARGELSLLGERDVRRALDPIVPAARRPNVDTVGPYIEAMSEVRVGLRAPDDVEADRDDVPGFAGVFERYRSMLATTGAADQDEYIFGAIEALLARPELRRRWQQAGRHLLVDEFQDLTPGYLLMLRLVASPGLEVFGVGDDDQVIYGYAGADPGFLIDFDRLFPGAGRHALEVNYRCPAPVVEAASHLLGYNRRRVEKVIRPGAEASPDPDGLRIVRPEGADTAAAVLVVVRQWLDEGVDPADTVVLCRVNAALLPVHAVFVDAGIGIRSPIGPPVLDRTVLAAALAWLRIGLDPGHISRADLMKAVRRPSRGLAGQAGDLLGSSRSVSLDRLRDLGRTLDGRRRARWDDFRADLAGLARVCASGDTPRAVATLADDIGLGGAAAALDAGRTRADRSGQSDDLIALGRLGAHHRSLPDFEEWLRSVVAAPTSHDGVLLTTVHRVKGLEWERVVVFGADRRLFPHELANDIEEERRVFHVALTRARRQVVVVADRAQPSPFLAELTGEAPHTTVDLRRAGKPAARRGVEVAVGQQVTLAGGFRGVVERRLPVGVLVALHPGPGRLSVTWGEPVTVDGVTGPLAASVAPDPTLVDRVKRWRIDTARAQGVPAYVVLTDATIDELAARRPRSEDELLAIKGIGPAKLDAYGDDLLALLGDR
jgi:DNA helicase-2/ATP-dependent DNA helicase PcrA